MKLKLLVLLIIIFVCSIGHTYEVRRIWNNEQNIYSNVVANEIIVQYNDISQLHQIAAIQNYSEARMITGNIYIYKFDDDISIFDVITELKNNETVRWAQPHYVYKIHSQPVYVNDADSGNQWYLDSLGMPEAWGLLGDKNDSSDVIVAVLDSGIDTSHPDLTGRIWGSDDWYKISGCSGDTYGFDAIFSEVISDNNTPDYLYDDIAENKNIPRDWDGHGTAVASIIGAKANDGTGMAGIYWGGKILNVRVVTSDGSGTWEWIMKGIVYAVRRGANIINMSLGGESYDYLLEQVINEAYNRGVILIASAGNDGTDRNNYPAAFDNVISVGATDEAGDRTDFSNHGWHVDFMAPGENIYVALWDGEPGNFDYWRGTSFSAPIVSGLAALILSYNPDLKPWEVRDVIRAGCVPVNQSGYGAGIVNARSTIRQLIEHGRRAHSGLNTKVISYPNPFKADGSNEVTFEALSPSNNINIKIYTLSGRYVNEIKNIGTGIVKWDGLDDSGKLCAPGTYLFVSNIDNGTDWGKFTIITW